MVRGIGDILQTLGLLLPPWVMATILAVGLIVATPAWLNSMRSKKIRGIARRMVRASSEERQSLTDEVMRLAGSRKHLLVTVVEQAIKYDLRPLGALASSALEARDDTKSEIMHLNKLRGEKPAPVLHPLQVVAVVERLAAQGVTEAAREHLEQGLTQHPGNPDLLDLKATLQAHAIQEENEPG